VKDVRYFDVRNADDEGAIYIPSWSHGAEARYLACGLRKPAPVIAAIGRQLRQMDPNVPLLASDSMADSVNANLKHERMIAYLCGCFGALALTLAGGFVRVMAYAVAQRTRRSVYAWRSGRGVSTSSDDRARSAGSVLFVLRSHRRRAGSDSRDIEPAIRSRARDPLSFILAVCAMLAVALLAAAIPRAEPAGSIRDRLRYE